MSTGTVEISKTPDNFFDFHVTAANGKDFDLEQYKGYVVLVVNTASLCGFTPQFTGLENLYQKFKDRKFVILGFPCNQFAAQDPGEAHEIEHACKRNFGVTFPLMSKVDVNGSGEHPLWKWMKSQKTFLGIKAIKWNFEKFLIEPSGKVSSRYTSIATPESIAPEIEKLIQKSGVSQ